MVLRINLKSTHDSDVLLYLAPVSPFRPTCPSLPAVTVFWSNRPIFVPSTLRSSLLLALPAHPLVGSFSFLKFQLQCYLPRKSLSDCAKTDSPGVCVLAGTLSIFVMSLSLICNAVTSSGPQQITDRPPLNRTTEDFYFYKGMGGEKPQRVV